MSVTRQLAWAWAHRHRGRLLLTAGAMALATSLVVFTIGGYRAATERNAGFARQILGTADVLIVPRYAMQPSIDAAVDAQLLADSGVLTVTRGRAVAADIEDVNDTTYYDMWRAPVIQLAIADMPVALAEGRWPEGPGSEGTIAGTVSGGLAKRWRVSLGDRMPLHAAGGQHTLEVIGITDEFIAHGEASGVYVSAQDFDTVSGGTQAADRLLVDLADDVDRVAWVSHWSDQLGQADPPAKVLDVRSLTSALGADGAVKKIRNIGSSGAAIALLAAIFIVWTSVATGAAEKRRELAMLRAIGAGRSQVVAVVMWESVVLALMGGLAGMPLGWLWLQVLALAQGEFYQGLIAPEPISLIAASGVTVVTGMLAGLMPALSATRIRPLEALAPQVQSATPGIGPVRSIAALVLSIAAAAVVLPGGMPAVIIGIPLVLVAVALAVGPVVAWCQRWPAEWLARMLGITADLMRLQQQSSARGAVGLVLTLAVCLSLSVTMNAWGRTMVIPFLPTPQLPDEVVSILPGGLPFEHAEEIFEADGLDRNRVLPMAVEQLTLGADFLAQTSGAMDELYVQVMGVDPTAALTEKDPPLLPMRSDQSIDEIAQALATPGSCVIPLAMAQRFQLQVGDELRIKHSGSVRTEIGLKIVALASLPGWQWVTKMGRMRSLGGKPLAPVVVSVATAKQLGIANIRHWLTDTTPTFDRAVARQALQTIADRHAGDYANAHFGMGIAQKPSVKIISTGEVGRRLQTQADSVIWVLGAIPLASLVVAMMGVANAIAMSIRARSWTFGIVRAVGLERGLAKRLVVVEVVALALAAGCISIPAGLLIAQAGIDPSVQAFNTGTAAPALVIPWLDMVLAWLITVAAAIAAAWLPARGLGRREPLSLLAAGRAGVD